MKKNLLLLVAFILTATVFIACGGGDGSTPTAAAEKCAELLKAGDYEGITNQLAFDENASKEDIDATKAMLVAMGKEKSEKQIAEKQGITSYKVVSEEIAEDGNTAIVKVEFTYGDGSTDIQKYDLKLVDGQWKPYLKK